MIALPLWHGLDGARLRDEDPHLPCAANPLPCAAIVPQPRVLVAEDDEISQAIVARQLAPLGVRTAFAANGVIVAATIIAAERAGDPFALVLMDLEMPVMGGLAAARAVRAAGFAAGTLPIVALTASDRSADRLACLAAGMQAHIAKPVDSATLAAVIGEWVPQGRLHDASSPGRPKPAVHPAIADLYAERRRTLIARLTRLGGIALPHPAQMIVLANDLDRLADMAELVRDDDYPHTARTFARQLRHAAGGEFAAIVRAACRALSATD